MFREKLLRGALQVLGRPPARSQADGPEPWARVASAEPAVPAGPLSTLFPAAGIRGRPRPPNTGGEVTEGVRGGPRSSQRWSPCAGPRGECWPDHHVVPRVRVLGPPPLLQRLPLPGADHLLWGPGGRSQWQGGLAGVGRSRGCPSRGVWAGRLGGAAAHEGGWTENLADTGPMEGRPVILTFCFIF